MSYKVACRSLLVVALASAAVIAAGCGGSPDGHASGRAVAYRPADMTLSRATLLRAADFTTRWSVTAGSRRERCADDDLFHDVTGRATSDSFSRGNVNVQQSVWLFQDARSAARAFASIDTPAGRACFRKRIEARIREQDSDIVQPLRIIGQTAGTRTRHNRYRAKVSRDVDSPLGPVQTFLSLHVDDAERLAGRGISAVVVIAAADAADQSIVRSMSRVADRRLAAAGTVAG